MNDVRPTFAAVITLFAALHVAKCSPSQGLSFRSASRSKMIPPTCCACTVARNERAVR